MISICMTYKNRKKQLGQTLKSIAISDYKDFEIILVDDGSDEGHRVEDFAEEFSFINLIRIENENKKWINPSIPYNMAFREAKGDKIIIQNAECSHIGDIMSYVDRNLSDNVYLNFACMSWPHLLTEKYCNEDYFGKQDLREVKAIIASSGYQANFDGDFGWYNHSKYLPRGLHFCSAITADNLNSIGGFDERFAHGYNFDDNELIWRIASSGMQVSIVDDPCVVHLFHYTDCSTDQDPNKQALCDKNSALFNAIQAGIQPKWAGPLKK